MMNKLDKIEAIVTCYDPYLVLLCETWTHEGINNSELQFPNYTLITRKDRQDTTSGKGGGLTIYAKNVINSQEISRYNSSDYKQHAGVKV